MFLYHLFNGRGRAWLSRQPVPDDERAAIERHTRELDRLAEDLDLLDREIAEGALDEAELQHAFDIGLSQGHALQALIRENRVEWVAEGG